MSENDNPAVIVIDREKLNKMLHEYTADQWDVAAEHVEKSHYYTKEDLVDSMRHIAQLIREKGIE